MLATIYLLFIIMFYFAFYFYSFILNTFRYKCEYVLYINSHKQLIISAFKNVFKNINKIQTLFSHIAIGSYIGTGTYGENSPTTINCNFKPKQFFIYAEQKIATLDERAEYDYVSINGGQYVSNNTRNLMINTYAPELNPVNRRRSRAGYLCLKVDEKENKFFWAARMRVMITIPMQILY